MPSAPDTPPTSLTEGPAAPSAGPCAICGKPRAPAYRPFCSKRCADVDLGRWLGGRYAIPGAAVDEEDSIERNDGARGAPKPPLGKARE